MSDEDLLIDPDRTVRPKRSAAFWLSSLAIVISSLSAAFTGLQWNETRRAANLQRELFVADHRPLLEMSDISYIENHGFSFALRNSGRNTAVNIRLHDGFEICREYISHYDAAPPNYVPEIWSSWHIKLHDQPPNGYSPIPDIASGSSYTRSTGSRDDLAREMKW